MTKNFMENTLPARPVNSAGPTEGSLMGRANRPFQFLAHGGFRGIDRLVTTARLWRRPNRNCSSGHVHPVGRLAWMNSSSVANSPNWSCVPSLVTERVFRLGAESQWN